MSTRPRRFGDEEHETSVHSVEVMALVAESSSVAVWERDIRLCEEPFFERRANILWRIRRVGKLIQATSAIGLCSTGALRPSRPRCWTAAA